MQTSPLHVAVVGCGAIGGVLGAYLTKAGARVTPVTANGAISLALVEHGYRVRELDGRTWSVAPSSAPLLQPDDETDVALPPFDLVIVATQSTRLESALERVRPRLADDATVVVCQNGLPEDRAARIVGARRVIGCVISWGASMHAPGEYVRTSTGTTTFGRLAPPPVDGPRARLDEADLARLLDGPAPTRIAEDFAGTRYSKLAINCCTTTLGAVGGDALGPLLAHRFVRRLALEIFAEVNAVARAQGVRPALVGGTLDITRVAITDDERAHRVGSPSLLLKHAMLLAVGWKYRRLRSSMLYALERGRPPEIDYLNGEVVRRGETLGVHTPVNRALVEGVRAIAAREARPSLDLLRAIHDRIALARPTPAPPRDEQRPAA